MIILIDNKNFMIRYCKDEPNIHGFDTTFPHWQGWMKLLSDAGDTVVVSGPEAEKYLDDNHIYYIHAENVNKESFFKFSRRLKRLIKENKQLIDTSTSFGKLVFAVAEDGSKGTIHTDNLAEIWRLNEDNRYYIELNIDEDSSEKTRITQALVVEKAAAGDADIEDLLNISCIVDDILYGYDVVTYDELLSAETLDEAKVKLMVLCEIAAE